MKIGDSVNPPKGWKIKKLREVCTIKPPKKEAKEKLVDSDIVTFLPMEDLGIAEKEIKAIQKRKLIEVVGNYTYFAENDVLLAKITPCFENGKLGIAKNLTNGIGFGSSEYIVFRSNGEIVPDFLFYFLLRDNFRKEGQKNMFGAVGHKRVSKDWLENYIIPLPPLPEQKRIVAVLDKCFTAIDKAKANAEQNYKNAKELFENYLHGVFGGEGALTEPRRHGGWEVRKLGDVLVKTETTDPTKNPSKEFIYVDVSSVNNETFEIENITKLKGKDAPSRARKLIRENDIIFATVRPTLKRIAVVPEYLDRQVCSTGYYVLRGSNSIDQKHLFYFTQTKYFIKQMEKLQKGASYPAVTDNDVKSQLIPLPPLQEQQTIVRQLDALRTETQKLEAIYQNKIVDLMELKKAILQKAFGGELMD